MFLWPCPKIGRSLLASRCIFASTAREVLWREQIDKLAIIIYEEKSWVFKTTISASYHCLPPTAVERPAANPFFTGLLIRLQTVASIMPSKGRPPYLRSDAILNQPIRGTSKLSRLGVTRSVLAFRSASFGILSLQARDTTGQSRVPSVSLNTLLAVGSARSHAWTREGGKGYVVGTSC